MKTQDFGLMSGQIMRHHVSHAVYDMIYLTGLLTDKNAAQRVYSIQYSMFKLHNKAKTTYMVKTELRSKSDVKKLSETLGGKKIQYTSKTVVTLQLVKASYDSYS